MFVWSRVTSFRIRVCVFDWLISLAFWLDHICFLFKLVFVRLRLLLTNFVLRDDCFFFFWRGDRVIAHMWKALFTESDSSSIFTFVSPKFVLYEWRLQFCMIYNFIMIPTPERYDDTSTLNQMGFEFLGFYVLSYIILWCLFYFIENFIYLESIHYMIRWQSNIFHIIRLPSNFILHALCFLDH